MLKNYIGRFLFLNPLERKNTSLSSWMFDLLWQTWRWFLLRRI